MRLDLRVDLRVLLWHLDGEWAGVEKGGWAGEIRRCGAAPLVIHGGGVGEEGDGGEETPSIR